MVLGGVKKVFHMVFDPRLGRYVVELSVFDPVLSRIGSKRKVDAIEWVIYRKENIQ
jgi:hypothetical protein